MLVVPLIPFALTVLFTGLAWIWSRTIAKRSLGGFRMQFMLDDTAQLRAYFLSWLAVSIPFVHIIYNGICMKVFNSLSCFRLRDGTTVLSIAPDIVCWDSAQHRAMVACSIIAILVYVIGIPAYVFCSLRFAKRTDQLKDAEWLQVLGFLYYRYGARSPSSGVPCPSMDRQGPLEHWVLMQCRASVLLVGARVPRPAIRVLRMRSRPAGLSVRTIGAPIGTVRQRPLLFAALGCVKQTGRL
jgi:hypothetical protein